MKTNTTFAKKSIVLASAIILGGLAPAVAPSVLNLNGGVVHAAEETHKVTIHYTLYDDLMFHLESSSSGSSKVFDVTPNQPLSDYIPETLPGGYVFDNVGRHSGGTVGEPLRTRNHLFGNWTDIYVDYSLREIKPRTNPSNAGTNNNEKPHKVTIFYCLFDGIPREPTKKVVDVTPNQPLSEHIPETLPGGYVFADAIANGGGSEGGVSLSSRNDLFGNETAFYVHYFKNKKDFVNSPGKELKLLNGSVVPDGENVVSVAYGFDGMNYGTSVNVNIAENPNATVGDYYPLTKDGGDLKFITDGRTMNYVYNPRLGVDLRGDLLSKHSHLLGEYTEPMLGEYTQPNNAGTNNNAGTEVKPNNDGKTTAASTPKTSNQSTPNQRDGWSGSSYYQNGMKVTSQWIFDKNYNSYFYLDASGNYVQNAWVGNYYLKSGGYMAKSEWIYDSNYKSYYYLTSEGSYARNAWAGSYYLKSDGKMAKSEWIYDSSYQSYYYLTSEGSYARNTWVGDYYLKSNGKMAVNERTPDGYQVDASGKWVR